VLSSLADFPSWYAGYRVGRQADGPADGGAGPG
jgi:hypothetical protein